MDAKKRQEAGARRGSSLSSVLIASPWPPSSLSFCPLWTASLSHLSSYYHLLSEDFQNTQSNYYPLPPVLVVSFHIAMLLSSWPLTKSKIILFICVFNYFLSVSLPCLRSIVLSDSIITVSPE